MSSELEENRAKLVAALRAMPQHMRDRLRTLKAEGETLRKRPDLVWYLLLQSAATQGNSRGWAGLIGEKETFNSVVYSALAPLTREVREARILAALRKAKVRMQTLKAPQLAANIDRIEALGGVERATMKMLDLPTREEKFQFMRAFERIGEKYGRNVWMDIHDPSFRNTIAVDERLKKVARAMGFTETGYRQAETFYCAIARDADLEPWELDRLLYNFTDHFLSVVNYSEAERQPARCTSAGKPASSNDTRPVADRKPWWRFW